MSDEPHTGQHPASCADCEAFRRRMVILHRALHAPHGLTPYGYTRGMSQRDALQFWNDARALKLVTVGRSSHGVKLLALPSIEVEL